MNDEVGFAPRKVPDATPPCIVLEPKSIKVPDENAGGKPVIHRVVEAVGFSAIPPLKVCKAVHKGIIDWLKAGAESEVRKVAAEPLTAASPTLTEGFALVGAPAEQSAVEATTFLFASRRRHLEAVEYESASPVVAVAFVQFKAVIVELGVSTKVEETPPTLNCHKPVSTGVIDADSAGAASERIKVFAVPFVAAVPTVTLGFAGVEVVTKSPFKLSLPEKSPFVEDTFAATKREEDITPKFETEKTVDVFT